MAPTLVAQIVRSSLRPLRDALRRQEHRFTKEEVQEFLDACSVAAFLIEKLREANDKLLDQGTEGAKLAFFLRESRDAVDEGLWMFTRVREIAVQEVPPFKGKDEGLTLLESFSQRAREVQQELAALLRWLDTPPPRVDPASLAGGGDSPTAEGYESIEDILARLRTGGEV
jgi:hypothetical protein